MVARHGPIGQLGLLNAPEAPKPPIAVKDVLQLVGIGLNLLLVMLNSQTQVPRLAYVAPIGFLVLVAVMTVGPTAREWLTKRRQERVRYGALSILWPRFRSFQRRLHDLLRQDSPKRVSDPLRNLYALECRGRSDEVLREKQEKFRFLEGHVIFVSQLIGRQLDAGDTLPRTFEEARKLASEFQDAFSSLDSQGIVRTFLTGRADAGHETWFTEWFDRFKSLVMEYETFAQEANRVIGEHVFSLNVRFG